MNKYYYELADMIKDHLWMKSSLNIDFLKKFPEFEYRGEGYRLLFSKDLPFIFPSQGKSFSKSLKGLKSFHEHSLKYDREVCEGKRAYIYKTVISGFELNKAINYLIKEDPTILDLNTFMEEEEIIAYNHAKFNLIGVDFKIEEKVSV